jgi:hypothetical protein
MHSHKHFSFKQVRQSIHLKSIHRKLMHGKTTHLKKMFNRFSEYIYPVLILLIVLLAWLYNSIHNHL